ncbi:hypothetical protein NY055_05970 [Corynebacterium diphtheriae bv. mitis]|nr:hypothetical protein NY055_05970 [Corynebacterium diphtheriae bv. mitis]
MLWSRNALGCPQVGHSLIGSMDSASITVTITVFCGAVDGIDDDISVGLHEVLGFGWMV